jgi:predicted acetyltransferase
MKRLFSPQEMNGMFEFRDFDYMTDGEIDLRIRSKQPANDKLGFVPAYIYAIHLHDGQEIIGEINLRIGYNRGLYYGGHIGYAIKKEYRGHHYAAKACNLVKRVAKAHGMTELIITCNPDNIPSIKTCERIAAEFLELVDLPEDNDMYQEGERQKNRYKLSL